MSQKEILQQIGWYLSNNPRVAPWISLFAIGAGLLLRSLLEMQSETDQIKLAIDSPCIICLEGRREIILLDCNHILVCSICSTALQKCPFCRKQILGLAKIADFMRIL